MQSEVPIQVAIRVRPLLGNEIHKDPCLYCIPSQPQLVLGKSKHFTFDYVFPQLTSQKEVYTSCVGPLISIFFEGYNTTVFAYGQTGSGKTYTMATGNRVYLDEEECGIIPRAVTDIFNTIQKISDRCVCKLRISFIEVYKEELKDLLQHSSSNVQVMDDESGNTVVMGAQEEVAQNVDEVLTLLDAGTAMRHVGSTNMNEESSRSHCIFTLILDQYPIVESAGGVKGKRNVLSSRFHFVDLAGSERAQRTGNQGERFKESISINTGLLALGNVISALAERRKDKHIPYRESKLTRILKDSLGGNSRTLMITCLSPALADLDENINSLKYAERARKIRNTPIINFDMESSKITQMKTEIEVLRDQLQRKQSTFSQGPSVDVQKISALEVENEKREMEQNFYIQQLHEVNIILQAVELSIVLSPMLKDNIENWRKMWEKYHFDRPITAPSHGSLMRRPQSNILENIRNELSKCKHQLNCNNDILITKDREIAEMEEEISSLRETNAGLEADMKSDIKITNEYHAKLVEQQLLIESFRTNTFAGTMKKSSYEEEQHNGGVIHSVTSLDDRVMQSFRAKSELLISQINDMDHVQYDDNISSDEENEEIVQAHWNANSNSMHKLVHTKTFVSQIPRLSKQGKHVSNGTPKPVLNSVNGGVCHENGVTMLNGNYVSTHDVDDPFEQLESERICARDGARTAEMNVREVSNRMKELQQNIVLKENLIDDLIKSEKEARATSSTFRVKLSRLEKEYEKSKSDLEDAQDKVNQFEKSSNKDAKEKNKLEIDFKKKYKEMQRKYDELKQKENISNRISSYQENNEKKVKDLEAWIGRMKNQHIELDRKLKEESEKKSKYEHELTKYGLRIKELELKTDQQQKLLKRKNEEVVAAQRKLRVNPDSNKHSDVFEQKKQWIDAEIDKILLRQRDMQALEAELHERDESLKKKESLMREKERLEVKRTRSSQSLSKSIMQLSIQVESVDEKIQQLSTNKKKFSQDLQQLQHVKEDLVAQRTLLEKSEETGGLDSNESRCLVELGEAIEAVDEAIQFKNKLIVEKQCTINTGQIDNSEHVNHILNEMGELTPEEYKHLLGKQLSKIIQLRNTTNVSKEAYHQSSIKVSEQERKMLDLQHMLQVNEARHEKTQLEQNSKYEKDIQFLLEQLRVVASETSREGHQAPLEKKVTQLEKELYYYKSKSRKYKDHLKDTVHNNERDESSNNTRDGDERSNNVLNGSERKPINSNYNNHNNRSCAQNDENFHLPNITSHHLLSKKDSLENMEEARRMQEIFDTKTSSAGSSSSHRSSSKRNVKKKTSKEDLHQRSFVRPDSMEVLGENPWIH